MMAANKQVMFFVIITEGDESPPSLISKPEFNSVIGRISHRCGDLE
jgi:hypothetical protein